MKKHFVILVLLLFGYLNSFSQISLEHTYTTDLPESGVKLGLSGLKYLSLNLDIPSQSYTYFVLSNPNHTLFKNVSVPPWSGRRAVQVSFISETLFDLDSLVEFVVLYFTISGNNGGFRVCNENGLVLLERDSAALATASIGPSDNGIINGGIFPDGSNTKLMVRTGIGGTQSIEIYSLPGQMTCLECNNGLVIGLAPSPGNTIQRNSIAFPNPFDDYVKIKFSLPVKYNQAFIRIYDVSGNLVRKKEIYSQVNEVLISNEEISQGAYIYQIEVDGKIIASDKIIKL